MAKIVINEISQNYTYNIGNNTFCTVALPITSSWGPGFVDPEAAGMNLDDVLENVTWERFSATQAGLESFVSTYRGPADNYRLAKDYSYQMAMTLITAGYDVLICRLAPGAKAEKTVKAGESASLTLKAKYPGTFGNSLMATLVKVANKDYWNLITYIIDASGVKTAVENLIFTFEIEHSTDTILHIDEIESKFFDFVISGTVTDSSAFEGIENGIVLKGGTDRAADTADMMGEAYKLAESRFKAVNGTGTDYLAELAKLNNDDSTKGAMIKYKEWLFRYVLPVYDLLKDRLAYSPNRIISPGWDDINVEELTGEKVSKIGELSPIHIKLMDVAYYSRCATAMLDIPRSLTRSGVWNDSSTTAEEGYAQKLSRYVPVDSSYEVNGSLYNTHSALFAPWGQYKYVGTSKQNPAPPAFQALLIQRSMILNQALQYEWLMPSTRTHSINLGKLDYPVPKKVLDQWQGDDGVGVNIITTIPDMGTVLWGNSTLYELPPATYQALSNLSTRFLFNAVKDIVYRAGTKITFSYNNAQAKTAMTVGVTPILDTMKNAGAIEDYSVKFSEDLDLDGQVKASSILGKIYITAYGLVNSIEVDMVALPAGTDLSQYK